MRVSGCISVCVCAYVCLSVYICVCVCVCVLCVCACYIGHTIIRLFLRKLAKRANICASFSLPFLPHLPLLPEHSSVASGAYAFFITYTYTCWILLRLHSLPTTHPTPFHSPLSTRISEFVSMSGASCVVQNMRIRCRLPCIHQHVMRRQQLPLATAPLTPAPPCCLCLASVLARLQQVPIKMLSIFALLTFQRNNGGYEGGAANAQINAADTPASPLPLLPTPSVGTRIN